MTLVKMGQTWYRPSWATPYMVDHWKTGTWRKLFCLNKVRRDFTSPYGSVEYEIDVGYCLDRCNVSQELIENRRTDGPHP